MTLSALFHFMSNKGVFTFSIIFKVKVVLHYKGLRDFFLTRLYLLQNSEKLKKIHIIDISKFVQQRALKIDLLRKTYEKKRLTTSI